MLTNKTAALREIQQLFLLAFAVNMLSFIITVYLLGNGASELNPIMAFMFSHGSMVALAFVISFWAFLYFVFVYIPTRFGEKWILASKYAVLLLMVLLFIDFVHDYVVMIGGIRW